MCERKRKHGSLSVRTRTGCFNYLRPSFDFIARERRVLLGRTDEHFEARTVESSFDFRQLQQFDSFRIEPRHHFLRRSRGYEQTVPRARIVAWHTRFANSTKL